MEKIKNLWFDDARIYIRTDAGNKYSRPLEAFPELKDADAEQRNAFTIDADVAMIMQTRLNMIFFIYFFR